MTRARVLGQALVNRRWRWLTLAVLVVMAILARLGIWQLDRLAERRAANAQLAAALASPPIQLNDEFPGLSDWVPSDVPESLRNRTTQVTGTYDFAEQRILKLQNWKGQPGVHLITPLVLPGAVTGAPEAVLVDRGWIPDSELEAGQYLSGGSDILTIDAYIALTETISRRTAEAVVPVTPGNEIYRVDIAALQEELPYRLAPFYLMAAPPDGIDNSFPVEIPREIDLSEGPHLSYAMQWFIFCVGLGIGYLVLVNRAIRSESETRSDPRVRTH